MPAPVAARDACGGRIGENRRMKTTMRRRTVLLGLAATLLLSACTGVGTKTDVLQRTLFAYVGAVRWNEGNIDAALGFIDPLYLEKNPVTELERERFRQVQISGYYVKGSQQIDETTYGQRVEVRLVNIHTQAERSVIDNQIWKWDEKTEHWWLTTGLPKIVQAR